MTTLIERTVLNDVGRWWEATGQNLGYTAAELYALLAVAAQEVDVMWELLPTEGPDYRRYSRAASDSLPEMHLQVSLEDLGPSRDVFVVWHVVWNVPDH